jgi:hypothetical protein
MMHAQPLDPLTSLVETLGLWVMLCKPPLRCN